MNLNPFNRRRDLVPKITSENDPTRVRPESPTEMVENRMFEIIRIAELLIDNPAGIRAIAECIEEMRSALEGVGAVVQQAAVKMLRKTYNTHKSQINADLASFIQHIQEETKGMTAEQRVERGYPTVEAVRKVGIDLEALANPPEAAIDRAIRRAGANDNSSSTEENRAA